MLRLKRVRELLASPQVVAVVLALAVTALPIVAAGANPLHVYWLVLVEPFTSRLGIQEVLAKTTPLILTGLSVAAAFKVGYWQIGAEGSLYAGALVATWAGIHLGYLPASIPLILILGFLAGGLWALPWVLIKIHRGVSEIVTTLLSNYVVIKVVGAILSGPWRDPVTRWPQSPNIAANAVYPTLPGLSRVHLGLFVGIASAAVLRLLLEKTTLGYEIRTVGENPDAARYAGMRPGSVMLWTVLLSGGLAGLAGVGEVLGVHHHLIEAISSDFGFAGIAVATLASLNPWGTVVSALFFGTIYTGSRIAGMKADIPTSLGQVIWGVVLITTLSSLARHRRKLSKEEGDK